MRLIYALTTEKRWTYASFLCQIPCLEGDEIRQGYQHREWQAIQGVQQ